MTLPIDPKHCEKREAENEENEIELERRGKALHFAWKEVSELKEQLALIKKDNLDLMKTDAKLRADIARYAPVKAVYMGMLRVQANVFNSLAIIWDMEPFHKAEKIARAQGWLGNDDDRPKTT